VSIRIVYYTRTGNTEEVVEKILGALKPLGAHAHRVYAVREYSPPLYLNPRLWMDTLSSRRIEISIVPPFDPDDCALLIVATPIWIGRPAPPIREFVERYARRGFETVCIATSHLGRGYAEKFRRFLESRGYRVALCIDVRESFIDDESVRAIERIAKKIAERHESQR